MPLFPASDNPLCEQTLHGVFARTAEAPFVLAGLSAPELPPVVIPPSRLKEVRRDFYRALAAAAAGETERRRREHLREALEALLGAEAPQGAAERQVTVGVRDLREQQLLSDPAVDRLLIPLTPGNVQGLSSGRPAPGRPPGAGGLGPPLHPLRRPVAELPRGGAAAPRRRLSPLPPQQPRPFPLFDGLEGVQLSAGYRLFSLNSQALLAWRSSGITEATLYIEDDRENLAALLRRRTGVSPALTVYASVPLITSRIPIRGVRADNPVLADSGEAYRVEGRAGLTVLRSENDFSLLGRLGELQQMGCDRFTLESRAPRPLLPPRQGGPGGAEKGDRSARQPRLQLRRGDGIAPPNKSFWRRNCILRSPFEPPFLHG